MIEVLSPTWSQCEFEDEERVLHEIGVAVLLGLSAELRPFDNSQKNKPEYTVKCCASPDLYLQLHALAIVRREEAMTAGERKTEEDGDEKVAGQARRTSDRLVFQNGAPSTSAANHLFFSHQQSSIVSPKIKMASDTPAVRVGVGVFVLRSSEEVVHNPYFLMGKRINSHGSETWALPGGHLEWGETPEECAAREVLEETGLELFRKDDTGTPHSKFLTATNDIMPKDRKHYITMFMVSVRSDSNDKPKLMEPEKCEGWEWVSWASLEEMARKQLAGEKQERTLFTPMLSLFEQRPGTVPSLL